MTTLWRVDADFENVAGDVVGMLTYFSLAPEFDERSDVLIGWDRDWYEIDAGELQRETVGALVGRPWPTLPLEDLVALASRELPAIATIDCDQRIELAGDRTTPAVQETKQQLDQLLHNQGINARIAWEKD